MTEHSSHYYEYDRNDPNREDPFEGNEINLNLDALGKNGFYRRRRSQLKEIREYLQYTTPTTHPNNPRLKLDLIESIGDEPFCRSNAIKYLSRLARKT